MKRLLLSLAVSIAVGLCGRDGGLRGDQPKPDPTKELAALQKEWTDAHQAFNKAYSEAKTDEERQQVAKDKQPKPADFADRFLKLAETYPDSPEAVQAIAWLLNSGGGTPAGQKAQELLPKLKEKLIAINDLDRLYKNLSQLPAYTFKDLAPQVVEKTKQ